MDAFEMFVYELLDDEHAVLLFQEIDEINLREPTTEPVDDFVERIWRKNEDQHRNPFKPPLPGN